MAIADDGRLRRAAAWAVAAAVALLAVLAGYNLLLAQQGGGGTSVSSRVAFVSAYITALALVALLASGCLLAERPALARSLLMTTAAGAVALAIPAIFSIGPALFVAAAVQLLAAARVPGPWRGHTPGLAMMGLLVLPALVLLGGFALTS